MLGRVRRAARATSRLTAVLALAGACGGTVSVGVNDSGVQNNITTPPVPYDATLEDEAGVNWSVSSPGPGGSTVSIGGDGAFGGDGSAPGYCPSSCRADSDCATCWLPGDSGKNCCFEGVCVMTEIQNTCPLERDSGGDAQPDAANDAATDGDGCVCTPIYQPCGGPDWCGCCSPDVVSVVCSGSHVCIPITN